MQGNDNNSLLEKAMHVGERLVELRDEASRLKTAASHAVEDAVTETKRFAKHGRYAAEDLMEDAAHRVKRRSATLGGPRLRDRPQRGRTGCMGGDVRGQRVAKKEKKE